MQCVAVCCSVLQRVAVCCVLCTFVICFICITYVSYVLYVSHHSITCLSYELLCVTLYDMSHTWVMCVWHYMICVWLMCVALGDMCHMFYMFHMCDPYVTLMCDSYMSPIKRRHSMHLRHPVTATCVCVCHEPSWQGHVWLIYEFFGVTHHRMSHTVTHMTNVTHLKHMTHITECHTHESHTYHIMSHTHDSCMTHIIECHAQRLIWQTRDTCKIYHTQEWHTYDKVPHTRVTLIS